MIFSAYTEEEWETLPDKYKKKVVGIRDTGEIIQIALCPVCGSEMANIYDSYLSCLECGEIRKMRILKVD